LNCDIFLEDCQTCNQCKLGYNDTTDKCEILNFYLIGCPNVEKCKVYATENCQCLDCQTDYSLN
jgi:hypothetical protein